MKPGEGLVQKGKAGGGGTEPALSATPVPLGCMDVGERLEVGCCPSTEKKKCERHIRVKGLTSPKLMRLACFRISVSPSRSFILRYLGMGARGQLGLMSPLPSLPLLPGRPSGPTCGHLASCAARRGAQAVASPASRVVAPATCRTSARSHPLARSPPGEGRRVPSGPCPATGLSVAPVPRPILSRGLVPPQTHVLRSDLSLHPSHNCLLDGGCEQPPKCNPTPVPPS